MRRRFLRKCIAAAALLFLAAGAWALAIITPKVGEVRQSDLSAEAKKLWSFGFVGDTHIGLGTSENFANILDRMKAEEVEFLLHLGDIVDDSESDRAWDELVEVVGQRRIRLLPVVGNHDKLKGYRDRGEVRFRQYFPYLQKTFYHFRHRGINFLMLNTEHSLVPWSEQGQFLRWRMEHHPGTTIVCLNRPVFASWKRNMDDQVLRRLWLHGALKGTDSILVLAGHHPYYERTKPLDGITYVISGGGGSKIGYAPETPNAYTERFQATEHYGIVDVYALEVRILHQDGSELDRFALALHPSDFAPGSRENGWTTELPSLSSTTWSRAGDPPTRGAFGQPVLPRPW